MKHRINTDGFVRPGRKVRPSDGGPLLLRGTPNISLRDRTPTYKNPLSERTKETDDSTPYIRSLHDEYLQ